MTAENERDRLISIPARSHITGEGRSTIYKRIKLGQITVAKDGRRTLLSEAEAYAFVKAKLSEARQHSA